MAAGALATDRLQLLLRFVHTVVVDGAPSVTAAQGHATEGRRGPLFLQKPIFMYVYRATSKHTLHLYHLSIKRPILTVDHHDGYCCIILNT